MFDINRYYSITEVANMFNIAASALRYWQKEFKELSPKKDATGNRIYTQKDIDVVKRIYDLLKVKGYKLEGAKQILSTETKREIDKALLVARLNNMKEVLSNLKKIF